MPTQAQIERANVEACFGLTGGELGSEPFGPHRYWYEGCPEWCTGRDGNYTEEQSSSGRYRTIVAIVVGEKPDASDIPGGWRFVALYRSCSQVDCTGCGEGDEPAEGDTCPYCEGGGVQWLGDEWAEIVVEQAQWECSYSAQWLGSIGPIAGRSAERADLYRIEHANRIAWGACWGDDVTCETIIPEGAPGTGQHDWPGACDLAWVAVARERFAAMPHD